MFSNPSFSFISIFPFFITFNITEGYIPSLQVTCSSTGNISATHTFAICTVFCSRNGRKYKNLEILANWEVFGMLIKVSMKLINKTHVEETDLSWNFNEMKQPIKVKKCLRKKRNISEGPINELNYSDKETILLLGIQLRTFISCSYWKIPPFGVVSRLLTWHTLVYVKSIRFPCSMPSLLGVCNIFCIEISVSMKWSLMHIPSCQADHSSYTWSIRI